MDKHDAEHSARFVERRGEAGKLWLAEQAGRHKWPGRQRGRKRDQRDIRRGGARKEMCRSSAPSSPRMYSPQYSAGQRFAAGT